MVVVAEEQGNQRLLPKVETRPAQPKLGLVTEFSNYRLDTVCSI